MDAKIFDIATISKVWVHLAALVKPRTAVDVVALAVTAVAAALYLLRGILWDRPDPHRHIYFVRPQRQESDSISRQQDQRNIAKKLSENQKRVVLFWGSQSGTAERFANELAKECQLRFGLPTLAADLSDYDLESIAELSKDHLAIFILSTYGEGDPSDNAAGFWTWITNSLKLGGRLENLRYLAFGLGNSNYKYYNRVVDVVTETLDKAGAESLLPVGKADDAQRSTEEDFLSWKDDLFHLFRTSLKLEEKPFVYQPTMAIVEEGLLTSIDVHHGEPVHSKSSTLFSVIRPLSIKSTRELFNSSDRHCVHMELDLSEHPEIHYKTGDHLAVWPTNPEDEVDLLLKVLGLKDRQDIPVSLRSIDPGVKLQIPTPTTARALFRRYLDICAPVPRTVIQGLAFLAPCDDAKAFLLGLGQDRDYFTSYLDKTYLTFGRLLALASPTSSWSNLPLSYVVETLPLMQPRYYSISSSSVLSPRRATITALVAADVLPQNQAQKINGVTSNYLLALSQSQRPAKEMLISKHANIRYDLNGPADLLQGTKVFASIRKSKFKLPLQSSCPVIMVAAGTGLAPFLAFISERVKLHQIGKPIGEMALFFGCRNPEEDYIYREELRQAQAEVGEGLFKIFTAFSRMDGQEKVYVQRRVREQGRNVQSLIEDKGASFYVCGRASMAREVGEVLGETVKKVKGWSDSEVKNWSEGLRRKGKWREDVWG